MLYPAAVRTGTLFHFFPVEWSRDKRTENMFSYRFIIYSVSIFCSVRSITPNAISYSFKNAYDIIHGIPEPTVMVWCTTRQLDNIRSLFPVIFSTEKFLWNSNLNKYTETETRANGAMQRFLWSADRLPTAIMVGDVSRALYQNDVTAQQYNIRLGLYIARTNMLG